MYLAQTQSYYNIIRTTCVVAVPLLGVILFSGCTKSSCATAFTPAVNHQTYATAATSPTSTVASSIGTGEGVLMAQASSAATKPTQTTSPSAGGRASTTSASPSASKSPAGGTTAPSSTPAAPANPMLSIEVDPFKKALLPPPRPALVPVYKLPPLVIAKDVHSRPTPTQSKSVSKSQPIGRHAGWFYNNATGQVVAIFETGNGNIRRVHVGDSIGNNMRVKAITPDAITLVNETTGAISKLKLQPKPDVPIDATPGVPTWGGQ